MERTAAIEDGRYAEKLRRAADLMSSWSTPPEPAEVIDLREPVLQDAA